MSIDFSIELTAQRINNPKTREYFEEVHRSYMANNFRSAIVMLWSIVVCDLLFKLDDLSSLYGDQTAKSILDSIRQRQNQNPKTPEWEDYLLEEVKKRTHLLEEAEYIQLVGLRKLRHLSAHPVLTQTVALNSPTRETVRAHIRNALEAVFIKPPIMTKKVFDALTEDLEQRAVQLPDKSSLKSYLESKYFPNFIPPVENSIFRSLWRLVFKVEDERCEKNRLVNYRALCIIYERRAEELKQFVASDNAYFGEVELDGFRGFFLRDFLSQYPTMFGCLSAAGQTLVRTHVEAKLDFFASAWYLSEDVKSHLSTTLERIEVEDFISSEKYYTDAFDQFYNTASDNGCKSEALLIGIKLYGKSDCYDTADVFFDRIIRPYIDEFEEQHIHILLDVIENNSQAHDRRRANYDHRQLIPIIKQIMGEAFEPDEHSHLAGIWPWPAASGEENESEVDDDTPF